MKTEREIKDKTIEFVKSIRGWNYLDVMKLIGLIIGSFEEVCRREKILNKK